MTYSEYKGRGYLSESLIQKIENNSLLFSTILNDAELDLRVRENKLHVYYKGGKLLSIDTGKNPKVGDFDRKYTYRKDEVTDYDSLSSDKCEKEMKRLSMERYNQVKNVIKYAYSQPAEYIAFVKSIMDGWFRLNPNPERSDQHLIATSNRKFSPENDLVVLDIEYAVSLYANFYNKAYIDSVRSKKASSSVRYPNPRFDMIGVDAEGQVYVIELKTGCKSEQNASKHVLDFLNLVGNTNPGDNPDSDEIRWCSFVQEVSQILHTLQKYFKYDLSLKVDTLKQPVFCFAYTDAQTDVSLIKADREKFKKHIQESIKENIPKASIPSIIFINKKDYKLQKNNCL